MTRDLERATLVRSPTAIAVGPYCGSKLHSDLLEEQRDTLSGRLSRVVGRLFGLFKEAAPATDTAARCITLSEQFTMCLSA